MRINTIISGAKLSSDSSTVVSRFTRGQIIYLVYAPVASLVKVTIHNSVRVKIK